MVSPTNSGQHLIDNALKMISGSVVPSSAIVNSGSLSSTYLGSALSSSHVSTQMDSGNRLKSSSSTEMLSDVPESCGLTVHACAATLFPVSAVFDSCFRCQSTSADSTECRPAVLSIGAGNYWYSISVSCNVVYCALS